ncbi:aldose 1-epimerase [Gemmata sp. JC673]|uniref:Aldose 1-epimerase n=1 Tax=Gemmata algarum TaxID=2975278 RepID=A0ABU5ETD8_9BACT|nr:aldose 1-epimerase [Gemmata algarum]MDY3558233.1 aldose 1-epimerase [Gemmata algarum]
MAFEVRASEGKAGDRSGTIYELTDAASTVRAEVWPQWGFNCLKWQVRQPDGHWADILFHMPDWESNPVPTRSGQPILFPFPGRLRDGRFTFEGKTYQLPLNESSKLHAIHGFTPRNRWRVTGHDCGDAHAALTGAFNLAKDFPEALPWWPSDFEFQVTYRLSADRLRVDARVENVGAAPLPFGLGYHGYFVLPGANAADVSDYVLQAGTGALWEAENNLPTGRKIGLPPELDFRAPRPVGSTALDNVFAEAHGPVDPQSGLTEVATLSHPNAVGRLRVLADTSFRDLVLFTPAHRHAVAIEPYSCSADASNLQAKGADSGWRVLPVGGVWESAVEYRYEPAVV